MAGNDAEINKELQHNENHLLQVVDDMQLNHPEHLVYVDIHDQNGKVQFWVAKVGSIFDRGPDFTARPLRHIGLE